MSRFFEALKEASRSNPDLSEGVPTGYPEVPSVNNSDTPPAPKAGNDVAPVAWADPPRSAATPGPEIPYSPPDPPPAETAGVDAPPRTATAFDPEAMFHSFTPRRSAFSGGRKIEISLDPKVPLIPNASDDLVLERYRRLRTKIQQMHATQPINSLLVTSPGQGDGKTVTVLNMAWSFGMLPSFKVLVIDGDLRRKGVGQALGLSNGPGFSNLLDGSASLDEVVCRADGLPFHVMIAGTSTKSPAELLTASELQRGIREMTQSFDLVLVDSPPVNLVTDAQMLAGVCDGVLVVGRALATTTKSLEKSLQDLAQFRIVGTVLNGATVHERRGYYNSGYSGNGRAKG
jgi:capsular exopolysaccharide synthesis family protein